MPSFYSTLVGPLAIGLAVTGLAGSAQAQTSSVNTVFAIVGARIEIGNGKIIPKGTVIIREGLIEAVGADVKVPLEAEIIKGDGLTVYPGFIDTHTTRGVTPPDAQPVQDTAPDTSAIAPPFMREANRKGVRPELRAADYLTLTDELLRPARLSGFTTEMITPTGGTITGKGVLVNLNGLPRRDSILRPNVAMNFAFRSGAAADGSGRGYPSSLMGIMAFTRQTLLDAQYYKTLQTAFAQGSSHRPPADEVLLALQPVLDGTLPVLYDADNENEIRRAIKMADEFGLKLILSGATEAYKVAPLLAQRKIPVLVSLNFGPEPGVVVPAGSAPGTPGGTLRPGGGRPGGGGRVRPGASPPAAGTTDPPVLPAAEPPVVADPGKQAVPHVPGTVPKPDKEDNVAPNAPPNQANRPAGATGTNTAADNPDDENSAVPKVVTEERHRKWEEKVNNALKLNQAGIPFAFATIGVRSQTEFLTNLRRAIKAGLPRDVALRALTLDAARLLGVDKQLGTVEAGKTAAIVVMSGDYVLPTTRVRYLFIDKNKFEPDRDQGPLPALLRRPFGMEDDHE